MRLVLIGVAALLACASLSGTAGAQTTSKTFIDYLQPTTITCSPLSSATWGVAGVLPRDICNGIESPTPEFPNGIYHYVMLDVATVQSTIRCLHGKLSFPLTSP